MLKKVVKDTFLLAHPVNQTAFTSGKLQSKYRKILINFYKLVLVSFSQCSSEIDSHFIYLPNSLKVTLCVHCSCSMYLLTGGPFTVFAPTDEAFDRIPQDTLAEIIKDTDVLGPILRRHVIPGKTLHAKGTEQI